MVPALTVVTPVWDEHTTLLPRCLRAVEREQIPATVVIVDNASRRPVEIPAGARRVTLPTRRSIGAARNAGLECVTTPFVVFADADDEVAPGSLARGLALLQQTPSAVGVIGRSIVDEYGTLERRGRTPRRSLLFVSQLAPGLAPLFWLLAFQASITSTILRTASVREAEGFDDTDIGEDWRLAARLARRGHLICLDDPVRIYHRHNAAARISSPRATPAESMRREIRADCATDPSATRMQRLVASILARRWR